MLINSASFQIVKVANILAVPASFPEHVCYYTEDTDQYYIYRNSLQEEVFITGGTNNSITAVIDTIHADLVTAKSAGTLIPGQKYRITDFQTIYDQPDFNADGSPKTNPEVKTGPVEPITVTAISTNELGSDAFQEDHPKDIIQYILEFTTPVTGTVTKGKIIKRIDERANETDFDHRNVLFKRYADPIIGDFIEYRDNGEAYQEFLCIQQDPSVYSNQIGPTISQYPFDLPNMVLGIFGPGDDIYCNVFLRAGINVTVSYSCTNNRFDDLTNCTFQILNTNVINRASNCFIYLGDGFGGNNIRYAHNVTMIYGALTGNNINDFIDVTLATPAFIRDSNISSFREVTSTARVDIISCNFNVFENITINDQVQFQYNDIDYFFGNTFNGATLRNNLSFRDCEFTDIGYCVFYGDFIYNRGKSIYSSIFKGHTFNNILTAVEGSEFGNWFGDINSGIGFNGKTSNHLLGLVDSCVFGSNCYGNTFESDISYCTFGDDLVNNEFQENIGIGVNKTTGPLFERQRSTVFFKPSIDTTTYSLGDTIPLGEPGENHFFYRSEIINGITYNFFAMRSPELAIWQNPLPLIPPNTQPTYTQLNTVDGLNNSMENTRKLRRDLTAPFNGQLSLGFLLNLELGFDPIGLFGYYPTLAELEVIYANKAAMGISISGKIWSSTEYDADNAYALDFDTGVSSAEPKSSQLGVVYIYEKRCNYDLKIKYDGFDGVEVIEDFI